MSFLKKPKGAALAMTVIIALSIVFGAHRSLSELRGQVEDVFFNGEHGDGVCIASDVSKNRDTLNNMVTVAKKYLADGDLEAARRASSLADSAGTIEEYAKARRAITTVAQDLYTLLGSQALSDQDAAYRESLWDDIESRNESMRHDPYNQEAQAYNAALERFPANFLSKIAFVDGAELFR